MPRKGGSAGGKPLYEHLMDAACEGHSIAMQSFLKRGADASKADENGWNTLFWSLGVQKGCAAETQERLATMVLMGSRLNWAHRLKQRPWR
eukprot:2129717-Rhodomonas_salina.2